MTYFIETIDVILGFNSISRAAPDRVYVVCGVVANTNAVQLSIVVAISYCQKI